MRTRSGALVDTGRVGRIADVRPDVLLSLIAAGMIPVIAPVAGDAQGRSLNVNADTAAGALAAAHERREVRADDGHGGRS